MRSVVVFLIVFAGIVSTWGQTVVWLETTQEDFADGFIDPNLYASWRGFMETDPADRGAVEWFPRFDLDNNGFPDFISSDGDTPYYLRVWYMGASGLDSSRFLDSGQPGDNCDFADLNTDGFAEIIHSGYKNGKGIIYWNNYGTFRSDDTTCFENDTSEAVYVADFDKDGYLDIVVAGTSSRGRTYFHWGGAGGSHGWYISATTYIDIGTGLGHNIESADFDGDGDLDLMLVAYSETGPLYFLRNDGGRTFSVDTIPLDFTNYRHGLSVADLDKDGDIDFVITTFNAPSSSSKVCLNDGSGNFLDCIILTPGACYGGSALNDFNGDNWLDILFFRGQPPGSLVIYPNSGGVAPLFSDATRYTIGPYEVYTSGGTVIDANNDGHLDIFVNVYSGPPTYSLLLWGPSFLSADSFQASRDHHGVFREPGNIRDRSKSAFYESNIFDTGFEFGACDGIVSWIAYDEHDYTGGTLPVPVGSEVIILARAGDHPTPDATWTDWDTLTDGGALPPSILGHRYYQYRAELWYSNPAYLPWLEEIEFTFSPCSCPEIDSVWFFEETYTDSQNLVQICYDAEDPDGDSFFVEIHIYDDTVEIPIATVYDTVFGYPGPNMGWVNNGTHCFVWNLGTDYYGHEGCDFTVQVSIHNETTEF
ncbi:MAG TPA: VCBS repeat-containing protein, partial [candidate division Zixibacteria bacterium]|nr:VCBS repeat-containing protein [candidate division Zixibacteria bacterium]